jgi:HAD superfamily hydrolase (TIGR01509 family)
MIKSVIFDIGGVLAYDVWEHMLIDGLNDQKRSIAAIYQLPIAKVGQVGQTLWDEYACKKVDQNNDWQSLEKGYWEQFVDSFKDELPSTVTADTLIEMTADYICAVNNEAMIPILDRLHAQGIDLAICSNNTEFWFKHQMSKMESLEPFFLESKIFLSCQTGYTKKNREMFDIVIQALGVSGEECVFVDDRGSNIYRAQKWLDMTGILFPRAATWGTRYLDKLLGQMGL